MKNPEGSMKTITKENGFAQVPHGIIDAGIPDTLKLLLWYCYDKSDKWTFSVPEVSRSLGKTKQSIRQYFRILLDAGVYRKSGERQVKHGKYPIYKFDPARVDAVVKSQLKVNPETDPEFDPETNPETDVENNPDTGKTDSNTDVPILSTENEGREKDGTETHNNKESEPAHQIHPVAPLSFEELEQAFKNQEPNPLVNQIKTKDLVSNHSVKKPHHGFDSMG